MNEVTRQDLINWFGNDRSIDNRTLQDLINELEDARALIFEHYGFN